MSSAGIVLTSGIDLVAHQPDFEGKIRLLAGIEYLRQEKIDRLYVLGGMEVDGVALDQYYLGYLLARLKNTDHSKLVSIIRGGVDTASDLKEAARILKATDKSDLELVIFTSGYHVARVALVIDELRIMAKVVAAEKVVGETHKEFTDLEVRIEKQEDSRAKLIREWWLRLFLSLDALVVFRKWKPAQATLVLIRKWFY